MTSDEWLTWVQDEWEKDAVIPRDDPNALAADQLHSKYLRLLTQARREMIDLRPQLDVLMVKKEQYFLHPTKEVAAATKWNYPAGEKILKSNVKYYLASDADILDLEKRINILDLRITFLEDVVKKIHYRGNLINTQIAIEQMRLGIK